MFILWFLFTILLIYHVATQYSRKSRLYSEIPGPKSYPIIGNILLFFTSDRSAQWCEICELVRKYYPISRFWIFNKAIVNVSHPDDLEIILSSQKAIEKGIIYKYLEPWLETGLLTSTDEKWRQRRKILTPAFHFGIARKYMEIVSEQAEKVIESLKGEGAETTKELVPLFSDYTLNVICEATMGVALDMMDTREMNQYKKSVHEMGDVIVYRLFRPYLVNSIFPYVSKMGLMQTKALKILHGFTDKVIQERREYHKNNQDKFLDDYNINSHGFIYDDSNIGTKKRLAMLDLLLAAEKKDLIDNAGIKEEVDTLVLEGHDTVANALTFAALLLAENKAAQDRAREEVTRVMDKTNGKAGVAEVQEFQYLERCIKESFRLFPTASIILRYIKEDLHLVHGLIPAHTNIMIHVWNVHRNAAYWPEPDKFNPDRFLPENSKHRHPFCFLPFSAGPRNCIGQKFAMMELKAILGYILYDFYLEPIEKRIGGLPLVIDMLLRPRDPVHIKFVKIKKWSTVR